MAGRDPAIQPPRVSAANDSSPALRNTFPSCRAADRQFNSRADARSLDGRVKPCHGELGFEQTRSKAALTRIFKPCGSMLISIRAPFVRRVAMLAFGRIIMKTF